MRPILAACLLLLSALPLARAEPVAGLYEADVPVASQDAAARDTAMRRALEQVLVKLSGSRQVLQNPQLREAIAGASGYVVQFYFRRDDAPAAAGSEAAPQALLHVNFQPGALDELLRRSGEPRLSANRPATLVWLVTDDGTARRIVNPESDPVAATSLLQQAGQRGVPLLFPLLDIEDGMAITPEQLWALDAGAERAASQRYAAESVLLARAVQSSGGEWLGEWQQRLGEELLAGTGQAATLPELQQQMAGFVAEALAARYAIRATLENAEELRIRIDGVSSYAAFLELGRLLGRLGSVRESRPALLERDTVFFDLLTDSGIDSVLGELALLPQLRPGGEAAEHRYTWAGK
jgi:hypothetical protein